MNTLNRVFQEDDVPVVGGGNIVHQLTPNFRGYVFRFIAVFTSIPKTHVLGEPQV